LVMLFGIFFAGPLFASASSHQQAASTAPTATTSNPYCQQFEQDLANRLNVSVSTLQQDRQAAYQDVLAQMVKDGKITQAQANTILQHIQQKSTQDCGRFGLGQ